MSMNDDKIVECILKIEKSIIFLRKRFMVYIYGNI